MTITGSSKIMFSEEDKEEGIRRYEFIATVLNVNRISSDKINCFVILWIIVESLREKGIPMATILAAVNDIEAMKEKAN